MRQLTPEEIERIRPAFNSNGVLGIFEMTVRAQHEKNPCRAAVGEQLIVFYKDLGYSGIARYIETLEPEVRRGLVQTGTGSIDWYEVAKGPCTVEKALSLQELYFGDPSLGISPLQWFAHLAAAVHAVAAEQIAALDEVCGELACGEIVPFDDDELF